MASAVEIPLYQCAAVREGSGKSTTAPVAQVRVERPGPGQILVKINWSGVCASDKALLWDEWADRGAAMRRETNGIAGHEGAGVVVEVGPGMEHRWKVGDRAGIKWVASTCGECEFCLNGVDELCCPSQRTSGLSVAGTFQQYCVADGRYTSKLPDEVPDEYAAPILCGGVTAYTGCKRSGVRPGQWVVVPGAGGGIGHFAIQYARAMGMRVIAIDGGDQKRKLCMELGAEAFIDFQTTEDTAAEVIKLTKYGAHAVLVTAASPGPYQSAPMMLRPGGTVVAVGVPHDINFVAGAPPSLLVRRRLSVVGSMTGTLKEVEEALDFAARGLVKPVLTKGRLEDLDEFLQKMEKGELAGRAVLQLS